MSEITLQKMLEWYVHLAQAPGWKDYVWRRVKEMAQDYPDLYSELPALLVARMKTITAEAKTND